MRFVRGSTLTRRPSSVLTQMKPSAATRPSALSMVIRPICRRASDVVASGFVTPVVTCVVAAGRVGCVGRATRSGPVDEQPATRITIAPVAAIRRANTGGRPSTANTAPPTASDGTRPRESSHVVLTGTVSMRLSGHSFPTVPIRTWSFTDRMEPTPGESMDVTTSVFSCGSDCSSHRAGDSIWLASRQPNSGRPCSR